MIAEDRPIIHQDNSGIILIHILIQGQGSGSVGINYNFVLHMTRECLQKLNETVFRFFRTRIYLVPVTSEYCTVIPKYVNTRYQNYTSWQINRMMDRNCNNPLESLMQLFQLNQ